MFLIINIWFFILSLFSFSQSETKVDGNFIGGLYKADPAGKEMYEKRHPTPTFTVKNAEELVSALSEAKPGDVIYLPSNQEYDMTKFRNVILLNGITLIGDRGKDGSRGALVYSENLSCNPLFVTTGNNITISGIRFRGPDSSHLHTEIEKDIRALTKQNRRVDVHRMRTYGRPNSSFINVKHDNIIIENCEIYNWSYAGVHINEGGSALVHHCYVHDIKRSGLGYGVNVDIGYAEIKANVFDSNRHAIAGSGRQGTSYYAHHNICYGSSTMYGHAFDMHGGVDRKDNTNLAGDYIKIKNNIFYYTKRPVIKIRGVPNEMSIIANNRFIAVDNENKGSQGIIQQSGGKRGNITSRNNKFN